MVSKLKAVRKVYLTFKSEHFELEEEGIPLFLLFSALLSQSMKLFSKKSC